ncbi:DNA-binding protein [Pectobacterium carotovorum subsp. carotovorum]|nr:phage antirepressor KilAC domain-containing protein [Pectobacterium carotovorum]MCL6363760.1 DNA-binding protein [Pectobacterium carotovorum subsp. carotovorum]
MSIVIPGTEPLRMTSREIAELTGKEHKNVNADIRRMLDELGEDALKFQRIYLDSMNRQQTEYHLDREHTECLITGYSAILRMRVIKRLRELESANALPADYPQALRHAADLAERTLRLQSQLAEAAPKIDFADRVSEISKGISIPNYAKAVGLGPIKLFEWMRSQGILITGGQRHNLPMQRLIDSGYFAVRQGTYETNGEVRASFTTMLTGKGEQWLTKKLIAGGVLREVPNADAE